MDQSWALTMFFHSFTNEKWLKSLWEQILIRFEIWNDFFCIFIKLIWLGE